jgi:hypothetical protein
LPTDSSSPSSTLIRQLAHLRRTQDELLDQITAAVDGKHDREHEDAASSPERDRSELVHRLLVGAYVGPAEIGQLGYELDAWHIGIIATGTKAARTLRDLKASLGRELLLIERGGSVWAWLGGARQSKTADLKRALSRSVEADGSLALGEPGLGLDGWRLTHDQAREAHGVAIHMPQRLTWYADIPLLAAALRNDTLARSLKQKYLAPLRSQRDGGMALRKTLRAYIDADCSPTSAESAAGVGRHAVAERVRTVERLVGRAVRVCLSELDVALRLEELEEHRARRSNVRTLG